MPAPNDRKFSLVSEFLGYRNREDITNLPPGVLVVGSQNVLTNISNRLAVRKGYTLYGQANSTIGGILSGYDWARHTGDERHLRAWGTTLEYLYVDSAGIPTWRTLLTGVDPYWNFAEFWDTTELIDVLLMVNGASQITEWSGGIATVASNTATTLTKEGTTSWAEEGFYTAGTRSVVINGTTYTYTGGETTTTLTGLTALPAFTVGAVVHQQVRVTANSSMTGLPAALSNDLIGVLYNQIYIGDLNNRTCYVSKVNNYADYSFSNPRLPGEGATFTLDGTPVGFVPQDTEMYITAGLDQWYKTVTKETTTSVSDGSGGEISTTYQTLSVERLKTNALQSAKSQAMITKIKNSIAFISREPSLDLLGKTMVVAGVTQSYLNDPTINNISDPIKLDFDRYNFDNASIFYYRYFTYVAIPREGIVRVYNHVKEYWEAPLTLPISRFSIINGELYGHSYLVPETYKLFEGNNDNGNAISAVATFSYQNFGTRVNLKRFNEFYIEGYIDGNTTMNVWIRYEIDGCGTTTMSEIDGNDTQIVCLGSEGDRSFGKKSLGKFSLARTITSQTDILPPKFRVIKTGSGNDFYEVQFSFQSDDIDQRWELLAFGPKVGISDHDMVAIKQ